jgi:hypothetical protein
MRVWRIPLARLDRLSRDQEEEQQEEGRMKGNTLFGGEGGYHRKKINAMEH